MLNVVLGCFGYVKIPLAAVQLIELIIHDLSKPDPPMERVTEGLTALKDMLRSARKIGIKL
jgi:hypothetical protein